MRQGSQPWLAQARRIWQQAKRDLQQGFSLSPKHEQVASAPHHVSSLYTAYTDTQCHAYAASSLDAHAHFLDAYRSRSPFPVYLSVLNSNGPKCYGTSSRVSCASNSPSVVGAIHQTPWWIVASILLTLLVVIGKYVASRRHGKNVDRLLNINHRQITSTNPDSRSLANADFALPRLTGGCSLDDQLDSELRRWLEQERNDGYRNLSEAYRLALNRGLSNAHVRFRLVSRHSFVSCQSGKASRACLRPLRVVFLSKKKRNKKDCIRTSRGAEREDFSLCLSPPSVPTTRCTRAEE